MKQDGAGTCNFSVAKTLPDVASASHKRFPGREQRTYKHKHDRNSSRHRNAVRKTEVPGMERA